MKKILVVDDLPENVFMLQDRLEHEGYEVITAYDGLTGIEKTRNELPDLILLDVMMPGITGFEDTKEGLEAGAFDYIKKPFNRIELLARVNSALKLSDAQKMLIKAEKQSVFAATVVTANHKIKQPLTLMNLSAAAIKRELAKEEISIESITKRLNYIELAIKEINDVLNNMNTIKDPTIADYTENIKMIKVDEDVAK